MNRSRRIRCGYFGLLLLAALLAGGPVSLTSRAGAPVLPNYLNDWYSVNGGGAIDASSAHWKIGMSVGQSAAGQATSASYRLGIGFWHATACHCPCHADPKCDSISNVQDVVQTVNVAFRGDTPVFDPLCPRERTDVNCDSVSTVVDVVKMVSVAFRGWGPDTTFCAPCAP
ncbi:MAG: hypothetical protein AB1792_07620 [Candidatus Zixiibacteriota bacterium]